ncbi:hypothetical protein ELQ43_05340 [Salmonella enterica subsp. enterica serovar Typhi]|nr:hypothetical protein [Salmonella enterica subsp. enterica serovar Typhi]HAD5281881.1 hypothetical protein [Salmonella enterica subsp. enterica serovar Typhi str. CT18]
MITLLLQKGNTLFRKTTLPMTVSQRRCRRKMQGLGAGDEEALCWRKHNGEYCRMARRHPATLLRDV